MFVTNSAVGLIMPATRQVLSPSVPSKTPFFLLWFHQNQSLVPPASPHPALWHHNVSSAYPSASFHTAFLFNSARRLLSVFHTDSVQIRTHPREMLRASGGWVHQQMVGIRSLTRGAASSCWLAGRGVGLGEDHRFT